MNIVTLETQRLILRQWQADDNIAFASLNADPEVMEYYPSTLTETQSHAFADKVKNLMAQRGWGFWAIELKETHHFIGFVGLHKPEITLPFTPCVEIGWRLARTHWGRGYVTEAGQEILRFGFEKLLLTEIVSFTAIINQRSERVMQRLGMINTQQNFNHPNIIAGDRLQEHILYKITQQQWCDYAETD